MAESIEAFVKKLQEEGVDAGRQAGQKVLAEAEQQAKAILDEANHRAKGIVQEAQSETEKIRQCTETELKLAARDAVGRLQETLSHILRTLLHPPVEERLQDSDFLASLIRDVVIRYVEADATDRSPITLDVSEDLEPQLMQWVREAFRSAALEDTPLDLRTSLSEAGFEYRTVDGTVEVTTDSVVNVLLEMVGPGLRKLVTAAQEESKASP